MFPIQFAKTSGSYDFISPTINFVGNALVLSAAGFSVGLISHFALRKLGYNPAITSSITAISVSVGTIASIAAVVGAGLSIGFIIFITLSLTRR